MEVSRSGYYKWKNRGRTSREEKRDVVVRLVIEAHTAHPSHGYRWTACFIRIEHPELKFSDNLVYKAFRALGYTAQTKHKVKYRPRKVRDKFPNLIFTTWETVDRPRQVIVSDMTGFHTKFQYYELTMYFDVFTKEILSWEVTRYRGNRDQYIDGLKKVIEQLEGLDEEEPTIIHTDQGTVYASVDYNRLIEDKNIIRSMSRAGKPTDNPVNESLNGWIKEELYTDFNLKDTRDVSKLIEEYVDFYNNKRPCYSIGYDTPRHYYERYMNGELEKKDTFSKRILTEIPKFVQKKLSTSKNEGCEKTFDESTLVNEALAI